MNRYLINTEWRSHMTQVRQRQGHIRTPTPKLFNDRFVVVLPFHSHIRHCSVHAVLSQVGSIIMVSNIEF